MLEIELHRYFLISCHHLPTIDYPSFLYNWHTFILGHGRADVFGYGVTNIAHLVSLPIFTFQYQMFLALANLFGAFHVKKFHSWKWHFRSDGFMPQIKTNCVF